MKVLIATSGTRGDVEPAFALAHAVGRAGHHATVAASPIFAAWAAREGLDFVACGLDTETFIREHAANGGADSARANAAALRAYFAADVPACFEVLEPLVAQAEVVVGASVQVAAKEICEARGKPYCHLNYSAQQLRSAAHPPLFVPAQTLPRWLNRLAWHAFARFRGSMIIGPTNDIRQRLGLTAYRRYPLIQERVALNLVATDSAFDPVPKDVRAKYVQSGYLFLDRHETLPEDVEAFLAAGPPPVYIGFGSMRQRDPAAMLSHLVEAVSKVGCRALLLSGWANYAAHASALPPSIHVVGAVSHRLLFPRVAAVVHHGGAGTTSAAALAGVPQLVIPHIFDQARWGYMVERHGLGPAPIPALRLTGPVLATRLAQLLERSAYREVAATLKTKLALDGGSRAVALLTELVAREPRPPPA